VSVSPLSRSGILFALGAYGLWGFLPLFFLLLAPAGPVEIVAMRIFFSLVFCALLLTVTRSWTPFVRILRQRRLLFTMALAGVIIFVNWQVYVIATVTDQVVEAALGYFINPIVTILLGVLVLHERLRIAQWVALGVSATAVGVLTVGYGAVPWIALTLAFSFGLYGLIKKRVGPRVDAISGLTLETMWLTPVAGIQVAIVAATTGVTFGTEGALHTALMMSAGIVTAVPLLFFASAAKRLPLVYLGFVQYLTPIIQFLLGVFVLHEPMPVGRWVGFSLIWVALIVLTIDLIRAGRAPALSTETG
jgi:chloramphenicol-sensitive protein RarD